MPRYRFALLAVLAVLGPALPATAEGATVSMTSEDGEEDDPNGGAFRVYELKYVAGPGEANDVVFSATGAALTVVEATVPLSAGPGCRPVDARRVDCPVERSQDRRLSTVFDFDLGDGDDRVHPGNEQMSGQVNGRGGEGDDVLTGAAGADGLQGGPGDDRLSGGEDDDFLNGGPGNDALDGGGGRFDTLTYAGHAAGVVADLQAPTAGGEGERDSIAGFESLHGGEGDDRLSGTDGANFIEGNGGTDTVRGRAGDDWLTGERLAAGTGDDLLKGMTSSPDCGPGGDYIYLDFRVSTPMPRDCERIQGDAPEITTRGRPTGGGLRFGVFHDLTTLAVIRLEVRDRRGRKVLGRGRARVSKPHRRASCGAYRKDRCKVTYVQVELTPAGRRAVRRGGALRISYRDNESGRQTFTSGA